MSGSADRDLLAEAVREGLLDREQFEACLKARAEEQDSAVAQRPLHDFAIERGYLDPQKYQEFLSRRRDARYQQTLVQRTRRYTCPQCQDSLDVSDPDPSKQYRCVHCSGVLVLDERTPASSVSGSGSGSAPRHVMKAPPEVEKAAADPRNLVGKYVLLERKGVGGMGEVWRAWDPSMSRIIALKIPKSIGEEEIRRLHIEAVSAGRLTHSNIASVYEIGQDDRKPYIAMQYIDGQTVEGELAGKPKRDAREIARWIRDAARGVHYAHENGVVHRDLKPQNLMLDQSGRIFVMDFGLAKVQTEGLDATVSGVIIGTPSYMPPEQAAGRIREIEARSDVYSLGATLYFLLSGKRPFQSDSIPEMLLKITMSDAAPLRKVDPSIPQELEVIVQKAMARLKEHRYSSAAELADDLSRFLEGRPIKAQPPSITSRVKMNLRQHRSHALTVGVTVAVIAGLLVTLNLLAAKTPPAPSPTPDRARPDPWRAGFPALKKALAAEGFDPPAADAALAKLPASTPERKAELDGFLSAEKATVLLDLQSLSRERWLDPVVRKRAADRRTWLAKFGFPTAAADRILAWRGTIRLAVRVLPWAELRGPLVEGLPEEDRLTPLALPELEIREGDLELVHPALGKAVVKVAGLKPGASYVLEGRMDRPAELTLKEVP